jgi:hypothetical protein
LCNFLNISMLVLSFEVENFPDLFLQQEHISYFSFSSKPLCPIFEKGKLKLIFPVCPYNYTSNGFIYSFSKLSRVFLGKTSSNFPNNQWLSLLGAIIKRKLFTTFYSARYYKIFNSPVFHSLCTKIDNFSEVFRSGTIFVFIIL